MSRARYLLLPALLAANALAWGIGLSLAGLALPPVRIFAEYCSTSAVVLMSANAFISTRPRLLDRWFSGLDKLFVAHRFNGVAVALLIVTHFTLITKTPGPMALKAVPIANATLILVSVVFAIAPRSPWRRLDVLPYHVWHLGHRFVGLALVLAVTHTIVVHPVLWALPVTPIWVYGWATLGLASYAYRETVEGAIKRRHRYSVSSTSHPGANEIEVVLEPIARPIAHTAGQFGFVRFDGGPTHEPHPFTISQAPRGGPLRFSVKASGDYTNALQTHLARGSLARVEGPYGGFLQQRGGRRQLWLAGGIGITPFLAFLGDLHVDRDVRLIWSVRTPAEATYAEEIEAAATRLGNVRFEVHATATQGHLDLSDVLLGDVSDLWVYICGPVPMRDAYRKQLRALGVPTQRIAYEEFSLR